MICTLDVPFQLTDYKDEWMGTASDVKSTLQKKGKVIPTQITLVVNMTKAVWDLVVAIW